MRGISRKIIRSLIIRETRQFILWAIAIGLIAAIISVLPALPATGMTTLTWITALAILFLLTAAACAWIAYRKSSVFR